MADSATSAVPVLWHLKASHYNEKARWALDHKGVPHVRRAVTPGRQAAIAERLCGGSTLPVLVLDGGAVGDSTAIIEALERRHAERPLYPSDPDERLRARELEEFFDEHLGPALRLLFLHAMLPDPDLTLGAFVPDLSGQSRAEARAAFPLIRQRFVAALGIDSESVRRASLALHDAGERFQAELESSGYLVGDRFTVADLTAAALTSPAVAPEQFPYPQPQRDHPRLDPLRAALAQQGLLDWTRSIYERHRAASCALTEHLEIE
jgi:glutathione S-transferase